MTTLYSIRTNPEGEYTILKFDRDYNLESLYALSAKTCTCPQGAKPSCRHRKLLPEFIQKGHINDGWFLDWDTRLWREPLTGSERSEPLTAADEALASEASPLGPLTAIGPNGVEIIRSALTGPEIETTDVSDKPLDAQASGAFCVSGEQELPSLESPPAAVEANVAQLASAPAGGTFRRRRVA